MPDEDDCVCGLKYKTGGQLVAALQMVFGISLLISGLTTINFGHSTNYHGNYGENWVSWCTAIGGCFCMTAASLLLYGVQQIMQLTRTRVIFPTPYVSGEHYPGAPAQVVINPGVQPGVYPAPYTPTPPRAYPGKMNPSYLYLSDFSQPPPYPCCLAPPLPPGPQ